MIKKGQCEGAACELRIVSEKSSTQVRRARGAQSSTLLDEGERLKGGHAGQDGGAEAPVTVKRWILFRVRYEVI